MNSMHLMPKALLFAICATLAACKPSAERVTFSVENGTSEEFNKVKISIGKTHQFEPGILIPNSAKSFDISIPIGQENSTSLTWATSHGKMETRTFSVTSGELTDDRELRFVINPDGSITKAWRFP